MIGDSCYSFSLSEISIRRVFVISDCTSRYYGRIMSRTLPVLSIAQAFSQTAAPVIVLLGGLVGTRLAPSHDLATLPVAFMIIGTAITTIPAALLMSRIGRKNGFMLSALAASLAGVLAAYAISESNFWLFCASTMIIGGNNAFVQQYRNQ